MALEKTVKSCILGASGYKYSSRDEADKASTRHAKHQLRRLFFIPGFYRSHHDIFGAHSINRAKGDSVDLNKAVIQLAPGIPLVAFKLISLYHTSLEQIVVVGSEEVGYVVDKVKEVLCDNSKIEFVYEGGEETELTLSNTLRQGKRNVGIEPVFYSSADNPFFSNINPLLTLDMNGYGIVVDFHSSGFDFPFKNPWSCFIGKEPNFRIKTGKYTSEGISVPNEYVLTLTDEFLKAVDVFYEARSRDRLSPLAFLRSTWKLSDSHQADSKGHSRIQKRVIRKIPKLLGEALFDKLTYQELPILVDQEMISDLAYLLTLDRVNITGSYHPLNRRFDIDRWRDLWVYRAVIGEAVRQQRGNLRQGLAMVYPYSDEIMQVREALRSLKVGLLSVDCRSFENDIANRFGLFEPYGKDGALKPFWDPRDLVQETLGHLAYDNVTFLERNSVLEVVSS